MIHEIRARLKSGESIEKVCTEYNLTFAELTDMLKYANPIKPKKLPKYISKRDGHYFLRKGNTYYGSYRTLEDAKKVRDYFIYGRWDKRKIDEACEKVGVKRIKRQGRY